MPYIKMVLPVQYWLTCLLIMIEYFSSLEQRPVERFLFLVGGMLLLWLLEGAIPLLSLQYKRHKLRHAAVNFSFTIMHLVIHTGFAVLIVLLSDWTKAHNWGLVQWLHAGTAGAIIIAFFVLDFLAAGWCTWCSTKPPCSGVFMLFITPIIM